MCLVTKIRHKEAQSPEQEKEYKRRLRQLLAAEQPKASKPTYADSTDKQRPIVKETVIDGSRYGLVKLHTSMTAKFSKYIHLESTYCIPRRPPALDIRRGFILWL